MDSANFEPCRVYEYEAFLADFVNGTSRTVRLEAASEEFAQQDARAKLKDNEELVKVKRCQPRRYRAMIEVKKLYRVFLEDPTVDSLDEAKAEIQHQIDQAGGDAHFDWEDRHHSECAVISLDVVTD